MPVFNAEEYLQRSLNSIKSQSYKNLEIIVVDGGSTDDSIKILRENIELLSSWITEPDRGIYDAMNKGVKLAKGDWIYFMGADDILVNCLHKVAKHLRSPRVVYYGNVYLPEKNKVYGGLFKWHTLVTKNINHQYIFYPRQVFDQYQFDLKYPILADYDLNIRIWGEGKFKFKFIPVLVALHNSTGVSSHKTDELFQADKDRLISKYFRRRIVLRKKLLSLKKVVRNGFISHFTGIS